MTFGRSFDIRCKRRKTLVKPFAAHRQELSFRYLFIRRQVTTREAFREDGPIHNTAAEKPSFVHNFAQVLRVNYTDQLFTAYIQRPFP